MKIILLLLMCFMLMSASNCSSRLYLPPLFEDCTVITAWSSEINSDVGSCFCIDERIKKENFDKLLVRVSSVMKQHPLLEETLGHLHANRDAIIKKREYELPLAYCRGYTAISPADRTALTVWAEDNRMGRISCELAESQ